MKPRIKDEQKAYLDGFEMCAECIEKYLSDEGRDKLDCLLKSVKYAVNVEDIEQQDEVINTLDKIRFEISYLHDWAFSREEILRIIDKYKTSLTEDKRR